MKQKSKTKIDSYEMPLKQLGSSRIVFKSKGAKSSDLREQFQVSTLQF